MPKNKKIKIALIILVIIMLIFSYLKAEYLTIRFGSQFDGLEQDTRMLDPAKYYKVISYSENYAKVYYISDYSRDLIIFEKEDGQWKINEWRTVWSKTGSADEFFWPYYR